MKALRILTLVGFAIVILLWAIWLGWYGKPAIIAATECCERNQEAVSECNKRNQEATNECSKRVETLSEKLQLYNEYTIQLSAKIEYLTQEVATIRSKSPVKWSVGQIPVSSSQPSPDVPADMSAATPTAASVTASREESTETSPASTTDKPTTTNHKKPVEASPPKGRSSYPCKVIWGN
jgi:hypothetical protein